MGDLFWDLFLRPDLSTRRRHLTRLTTHIHQCLYSFFFKVFFYINQSLPNVLIYFQLFIINVLYNNVEYAVCSAVVWLICVVGWCRVVSSLIHYKQGGEEEGWFHGSKWGWAIFSSLRLVGSWAGTRLYKIERALPLYSDDWGSRHDAWMDPMSQTTHPFRHYSPLVAVITDVDLDRFKKKIIVIWRK